MGLSLIWETSQSVTDINILFTKYFRVHQIFRRLYGTRGKNFLLAHSACTSVILCFSSLKPWQFFFNPFPAKHDTSRLKAFAFMFWMYLVFEKINERNTLRYFSTLKALYSWLSNYRHYRLLRKYRHMNRRLFIKTKDSMEMIKLCMEFSKTQSWNIHLGLSDNRHCYVPWIS